MTVCPYIAIYSTPIPHTTPNTRLKIDPFLFQSQRKAYLSAIVALLYDGDGVGAQATYTDVCAIPAFEGSEEQRVAYALLDSYRDAADAAAIQNVCAKSQELAFLEAPFARAAKKLPLAKHDLARISVAMGGTGGIAAVPVLVPEEQEAEDDLT